MYLAKGNNGTDIGELHQELLERGLDVAAEELRARVFGPSTELAVQAFQTANVDSKGRALLVDGVVGTETWAALHRENTPAGFLDPQWQCDPEKMEDIVRPVVRAAVADLGRYEDPNGSNSGPLISKFLPKNVPAAPWCAYAVSTWLEDAPGGSPFPHRLGSVRRIVAWGREKGRLVDEPIPGDLWCALRGDGHGHVELIVGTEGSRLFLVGGNVRNAVRGTVRGKRSASFLIRPILR